MSPKNLTLIKQTCGLGFQLAKAEFKLRNEGSYLGIFWYLLNPILTFGVLYFIFADKLGSGIQYYSAYLLLGIILFNLFQTITAESTKSILREYHYLIKSINFPRESLILSIVLKHVFAHIFECILFCVLLVSTGISLIGMLYYIPLIILFVLFIYGFSLLISALTVYFVDLDNIWSFAIRIIWFGTPIFYMLDSSTLLHTLNMINPLYYFISTGRDLIIYQTMPSFILSIGTILWSICFLSLGTVVFSRLKIKFAELI